MKNIVMLFCYVIAALCIAGCTSVKVSPIPSSYSIKSVTIKNNPKVRVSDYTDVLIDGFERHGINAKVVSEKQNVNDGFWVTYTALRSWDMATYLCHAEVDVWHGNNKIGSAEYHLIGKGGLSFYKWQGTETKMTPVMDELLKEYPVSK